MSADMFADVFLKNLNELMSLLIIEEKSFFQCNINLNFLPSARYDGIGDSPYKPTALYVYGSVEKITQFSPDNYPLMSPFDVDSVEVDLPGWAKALLNPTPTPTPTPTQAPTSSPESTQKPEPLPTNLLIASAIAAVALAGLGLLVYFKKRK